MKNEKLLKKYITAALVRLRFEKVIYQIQSGLLFASFCAVLIFLLSRMFILPYYERYAFGAACIALVASVLWIIYKRVQLGEAVRKLDEYIPENILITAVSLNRDESILANAVIDKASTEVSTAFESFKKRKKTYLNVKMFGGFVFFTILLIGLMLFSSEPQAGLLVPLICGLQRRSVQYAHYVVLYDLP